MIESRPGALQYIKRQTVDRRIFDRATNVRHPITLGFVDAAVDYLVCVTNNCKVGIVRHDNHLPFATRLA